MIIITVIVPVAGLLIMISAAIAFRVQAVRAAREEDHWVKDESRLARLAPHRPMDDDFAQDDIPEFTPGHRSTATDLDWDSGGFLAAPTIAPSRDEPLSAPVDARVSEPARTARTAGAARNAGPATRSSQAPQSFGRPGNHVDHARGRADQPTDQPAEDPDDPWTRLSFSRPTWPAGSVPDDDPGDPADAAASPSTARGARSVGRTPPKGPPSPSSDRYARKLPTVAELVQRIQTERYAPGTAYGADAGDPRESSRPDLVGRSWTHPQIRPQERSEPQPRPQPHTGGQPRPHSGGQTGPRPRPQPATGSPAHPAAQSGPQALPGSGPRLRPPTTTGPQAAPRTTGPQGRPPAETGPRSGARPQPQPQTGPQTGPQPQPRTEPVRVPDEPPYGSTGAWPTVPGPRLPADNTPPTGRLCRERLSELDSTPGIRSPGRPAEGEPAACPDQPFDRRDTDHADRAGRSDRSGQGGRRGPLVHRHPADGRWRP